MTKLPKKLETAEALDTLDYLEERIDQAEEDSLEMARLLLLAFQLRRRIAREQATPSRLQDSGPGLARAESQNAKRRRRATRAARVITPKPLSYEH